MQTEKHPIHDVVKNSLHLSTISYLIKWLIISSIVGILAGSASALFLATLYWATETRISNPYFLYLLPVAGVIVSYAYTKFGANSGKGNNLILEQIQGGKEHIPLRMAPLVLFGTIMTHLFGGSAGREGTAVQMASSMAESVGKVFKLDKMDRKIILISGISAGFGSVFGTPLAGTVFGLEVIALGIVKYQALYPAFVASFVGDYVTTAWGIGHSHYELGFIPEASLLLVVKVVFAAVLFGLAGMLFSQMTYWSKTLFAKYFANPMLRSFVGGLIVLTIVLLLGTTDYIGLGLPLIYDSFEAEVSPFAFFLKTLLTSITLGAGFQGGEVTPLFVVGATLGNTISGFLGVPAPFLAALGFIAVFAAATNTPIACFIMGIELFGADAAIYMFMATMVSYFFSGHTGIYSSQKIGVSKSRLFSHHEEQTLLSAKKQTQEKEETPWKKSLSS
ncbi:voltage-gated chloride channel protein [Anaerobacillus alkalidiazotrophicus]|uniref:Voltage-gated chloride channel protein n=1 Tax=Anaerobacillus alkalidiazotrophicus TaxID=472963 RepID=A0A1S2M2Q1_9BACI|nr:voltage-gated chloride channel family protein [Anaerobacillus alkalidiazotrophicus]OIJ18693.1 voltage-gated chloride channel protein [Anaerobacillus alkalidiazotrophicus]